MCIIIQGISRNDNLFNKVILIIVLKKLNKRFNYKIQGVPNFSVKILPMCFIYKNKTKISRGKSS